MEMTNRRWIAIVALSCATLAALRLPPRPPSMRMLRLFPVMQEQPADVASKLRTRISDLAESSTLLARRDSLLAAARVQGDRAGPLIVTTARVTPRESEIFAAAITKQAAAITSAGRNLVVGIVVDTSTAIPTRLTYRTERQFVLPSATDGERCLTVVRLGRGRRELEPEALNGIMGPCAFYAAFGAPGKGIEEWLHKRRYDVAYDAVWPANAEPNPDQVAVRPVPVEEDLHRWLDISRNYRSLDITACSGGDVPFCASLMRRAQPADRPLLVGDAIVGEPHTWQGTWSLGPQQRTFLADLLAAHGRSQFEKFWKSSADLETAFNSAFGESTGEWTMRWMQHHYGPDTRGPATSSRGALFAVLASLGLVAATAAVAHHREAV